MPQISGGFKYDEKAGYLRTALTVRRTVVAQVLARPTFWLFLGLHFAVNGAYRLGHIDECKEPGTLWYIGWHEMGIISGMTTFFEVFYTNECWKRYQHLYTTTRRMLGITYEYIVDMRLISGRVSHPHVRLSSRYLLSAVMLFFYEVDDVVTEEEWCQMRRLGLLSGAEIDRLRGLTPVEKTTFLIHWCIDVGQQAHAMAVKKVNMPQNSRVGLLSKVQLLRDCQQEVRDTLGLPVPFQYFHLLNMMIVINLFLWAYGMGCATSPLYTGVFVFASLIFMGMMELASAFSDPFGTDEVDFPVGMWLTEWLGIAVTLLEYEMPGQEDDWQEILMHERPLAKELVNLELFMDCGFADSPKPGAVSDQMLESPWDRKGADLGAAGPDQDNAARRLLAFSSEDHNNVSSSGSSVSDED